MDTVIARIQKIELKVKKLTLALEQYKTDNELLKAENSKLNQLLRKYEGRNTHSDITQSDIPIASLDHQASKQNEPNMDAIKSKLDRYIKEVDKCIELVNNW